MVQKEAAAAAAQWAAESSGEGAGPRTIELYPEVKKLTTALIIKARDAF